MEKNLKDNNGLPEGEEIKAEENTESVSSAEDNSVGQNGSPEKGNKKPLSKQTLIRIIAIAAAAVVAVVALTLGLVLGLKKDGTPAEYTVEFKSSDHIQYSVTGYSDVSASGKITVESGTQIIFSLVIDEDFSDPIVTANTVVLSESEGKYSLTVNANTVISVSGLIDNSVRLSGEGTQKSPYVVNNLRELNYVAARVNRGESSYVLGYFVLGGDIDCGGENISVIGDAVTDSAFFAGCFDGNGHTIFNYKINSVNRPYAGLFGMVQQYVSATSADENSGTVKNLHLKDFEVYAHAPEGGNVIVGSVAGYGMAAKFLNCSAVNGMVTIIGNNFFSYSGGAVGILQSGTHTGIDDNGNRYLESYYAVINGVHTDVDLYTAQGFSYASGGIVSYVMSDHSMSTAFVTNSYSEGKVFNAMRVGGIAGYIGNHSSIANCYSTGELRSESKANNAIEAYDGLAGGIAAYAGIGAVISNSFSTADIFAYSVNGNLHTATGGILARAEEASGADNEVIQYNCFSGSDAKVTEASFIKDTLNWSENDWVINNGSAPVLSGKLPENVSVTITADYGEDRVGGKAAEDVVIKVDNYYLPIIDHFKYTDTELKEVMSSDGGNTSYGYFFDAKKEYAVPYGFVPTNNLTLYAGFADYSQVADTYTLIKNDRTLTLTMLKSGEYVYADGINFASTYVYDGSKIIFNDAAFARLSSVITDNEPNQNFELYGFVAELKGNELCIYDGVYFTAADPLKFTKGTPANSDEFVGTWEKSATINRTYKFESTGANVGRWEYSESGKSTLDGTYSVNNGIALLLNGNGVYASARIAPSGLIQIALGLTISNADDFTEQNSEYFGYFGGLLGTWFDTSTGDYVVFNGYGSELAGSVLVNVGGNASQLKYIRDGFFDADGLNGYCLTLISPTTGALFGYLNYDPTTKALNGSLYNASSGGFTQGYNFRLVDNYSGEWIGKGSVSGVDFKLMNFNGFGAYEVSSALDGGSSGYVEINGVSQRVKYSVDITNGLVGKFNYEGKDYTLKFNEKDGCVTVTDGTENAVLVRKDELYKYTLVTGSTTYMFNGGGHIGAGIMTVSSTIGTSATVTEYEYEIVSGSVVDKNIVVNTKNIKTLDEGTLTISGSYFLFKENAESYGATLSVKNSFVGSWAISRWFQPFTISEFDLDGKASGRFQGFSATYSTISDTCILVSYFTDESTSAVSSYIVLVDDDTLAISDYPYLVSGGYVYAARQDGLFGSWTNSSTSRVLQFDGLGYSKFDFGAAINLTTGENFYYTYRFGKYYMWIFNDESQMFVVKFLGRRPDIDDFYSSSMGNFVMEKFEAASTAVFSSKDRSYEFYLDGTVLVDGVIRAYDLVEINGSKTTLIIRVEGGEDITAIADDSDGSVTLL